MSFKITFGDDWEKLRKSIKTDETVRKIVPDVTVAILKLHNTLERRVGDLFNIPYPLGNVMIGSSKSPAELGNTFLRYNLQYRDKKVPLVQYPWIETPSTAKSFAPLRKVPLGSVHWKEGEWSKDIYTRIRKGSTPSRARRGGNFSKLRGFFTGTNIKAREQEDTWLVKPDKDIEGTRAPYSILYGPSLATLTSKVYDVDKEVAVAADRLQMDIIEAIVRSYNA